MGKTDHPDEHVELDGLPRPIPFYVEPADFAWRPDGGLLDELDQGYSIILNRVIPYLERQAAWRLQREWSKSDHKDYPDLNGNDSDQWRDWWLKEVSQYCSAGDTAVIDGGTSLSAVGQAAVNIFVVASHLRIAIEQKQSEKASALGMVLLAESLLGGYALQHSAAMEATNAMRYSRRAAFENGIGKGNVGLVMAKVYTETEAKRIWGTDSTLKIGAVAKEVITGLKLSKKGLCRGLGTPDDPPVNFDVPDEQTVKRWIREAAKQGNLLIPANAQSPGRPRKEK